MAVSSNGIGHLAFNQDNVGSNPITVTMDEDLQTMSFQDLYEEVVRLRNGIRKHRDATGHNLCWYVPELWDLLPEKVEPKPEVPPKPEFMACCKAYRDSLGD